METSLIDQCLSCKSKDVRLKAFSTVNDALRRKLLNRSSSLNSCTMATSYEISNQLRQIIPLIDLKESGSFFTGDEMAAQAMQSISKSFNSSSQILDPTCGAGNLLIAASRYLPVFDSLAETAELWGKRLFGFDLHAEFVECTKLRLIQTAIDRGATLMGVTLEEIELLFRNIKVGNIFSNMKTCSAVSHVIMNPPYMTRTLPVDRTWSRGKVNMAAVFTEDVILHCKPGTRYVAILPDVLRSGSRYSHWRDSIALRNTVKRKIVGQFDTCTNVDVFLMFGLTGKSSQKKRKHNTKNTILGDVFDIRIGPLVAYRDNEIGQMAPYVQTKQLMLWAEMEPFDFRKTGSTLTKPPFVVVNRTSSPSDKNRARATIIVGKDLVAVENHLVILKPKKGGVRICRKLVSQLKSTKTNDFLNERIRCRHLTVSAVKEIPWQEEK